MKSFELLRALGYVLSHLRVELAKSLDQSRSCCCYYMSLYVVWNRFDSFAGS